MCEGSDVHIRVKVPLESFTASSRAQPCSCCNLPRDKYSRIYCCALCVLVTLNKRKNAWNIFHESFLKNKFLSYYLPDINFPRNSPIYDEYQIQTEKVPYLPCKQTHQGDSNNTQQPMCYFQVRFPLLRMRMYLDEP